MDTFSGWLATNYFIEFMLIGLWWYLSTLLGRVVALERSMSISLLSSKGDLDRLGPKDGLPRNPLNSGCPDGVPSAPVVLQASMGVDCGLPRHPRNSGCPVEVPPVPVALRESLGNDFGGPRYPRNSGCPGGLPSGPVALRTSLVDDCELK